MSRLSRAAALLAVVASLQPASCATAPEPIPAPPLDHVIPLPAVESDGVEPAALAHLLRGLHFAASGHPGAAVPDLRLALLYDPDSPFLHRQLALAWITSGEADRGRSVLRAGLGYAPADPGLNLLAGELAVHDGRFAVATDHFEKAAADESLLGRAGPALVDALAWTGREEAAEARAQALAARAPADAGLALGLAAALEDHGLLEAALATYRHARDQRPSDEGAAFGESRILSLLGRHAEAADSLVPLFEYYPDEVSYFAEIGRLLRLAGRPDADAYRDEALRQASGDPESRLRVAAVDLAAGDVERATALLREVVEQWPEHAEARLFLAEVWLARREAGECLAALGSLGARTPRVLRSRAECLAAAGDLAAARAAAEEAVRAGDAGEQLESAAALFARYAGDRASATAMLRGLVDEVAAVVTPDEALVAEATLLDWFGRREALRLVERLSSYQRGDREVLLRWADLAARHGELDESLAVLERLVRDEPQSPVLLNALGFTLADAKIRLEEAEVWLRRAYRLAPEEGFIMDSLGWLLYRRGDLDGALRLLAEASGASAGDPEILRHLGDAYRAAGREGEARSCYERALARRPPVPLRSLLERRLAGESR